MPFEPDLEHLHRTGRSTIAVIGVIDLRAGRAVHARGGRRETYRPVEMVAGRRIRTGDAVGLAREYVERLGVDGLYVADLDAILGEPSQDALVRAIVDSPARGTTLEPSARGPEPALTPPGRPVWLDAGVTTVSAAQRALALGVHQVIVGLETLETFEALDAICAGAGGARIAFSLDLRNGVPVARERPGATGLSAPEVARRAADAGVGTVLVLDLARVGMEGGPDVPVIARVRDAVPHVVLLAGGGVRGGDDVRRLADTGCHGVLVASALLSGALA